MIEFWNDDWKFSIESKPIITARDIDIMIEMEKSFPENFQWDWNKIDSLNNFKPKIYWVYDSNWFPIAHVSLTWKYQDEKDNFENILNQKFPEIWNSIFVRNFVSRKDLSVNQLKSLIRIVGVDLLNHGFLNTLYFSIEDLHKKYSKIITSENIWESPRYDWNSILNLTQIKKAIII